MEFSRFYKLSTLMQAFSIRDLQMYSVITEWGKSCGYTTDEVVLYAKTFPTFVELYNIGYFSDRHSPEQLKQFRELEKRFPKDLRHEMRQARLANSHYGPIGKGHG